MRTPPLLLFIVILILRQIQSKPNIYLQETFDDGEAWKDRWVQSKHSDGYGKWQLSHGKLYADENDKGLQTSQDAKFYAISRKLDKPLDNKDKPLVIVYTVRFEQEIDCGGGYVKLMDKGTDLDDFSGNTAYRIMFGPDICGPEKRVVHAILSYKGTNYQKNKPDVIAMADEFTNIYKLIIFPDNKYEIWVNKEIEAEGYLEDDWEMVPSRTIEDEDAVKPEEWDERHMIPDPNATKPEDWDQPETIKDTNATKPEDWDDEMDGEWEPPTLQNPDFKGEWHPPMIDNPKFNGTWQKPKIPNPDYVETPDLHDYSGVDSIGLELWQVKSGTIIDNLLITDDPDYANEFMNKTLSNLKPIEDVEAEKKNQKLYQDIVGRMGGGGAIPEGDILGDEGEDEDEDDVDQEGEDEIIEDQKDEL